MGENLVFEFFEFSKIEFSEFSKCGLSRTAILLRNPLGATKFRSCFVSDARECVSFALTYFRHTSGTILRQGVLENSAFKFFVFSENSSFEPVVSDLILQFNTPVNILYANTKDVGGIAKGDMVITLPEDKHMQVDMIEFLKNKGLEVQEVAE